MDDACKLIAAGKIQRWEVLKWGVTVNMVLATASVALRNNNWPLLPLAIFVAALSGLLIYHYNLRIARARWRMGAFNKYVISDVFNANAIITETGDKYGSLVEREHDRRELLLFALIFVASVIVNLIVIIVTPGWSEIVNWLCPASGHSNPPN